MGEGQGEGAAKRQPDAPVFEAEEEPGSPARTADRAPGRADSEPRSAGNPALAIGADRRALAMREAGAALRNEITQEKARRTLAADTRRMKLSREGSEYRQLPDPPLTIELGRRTLPLQRGLRPVRPRAPRT